MTFTHEHSYTTTILVKNIHCASCEATIQGALEEFRPTVKDVQINILRAEVRLVHHATLDVLRVCIALQDAAFEVHSFVTMDFEMGTQVREIEFRNEIAWFEGIRSQSRLSTGRMTPLSSRHESMHMKNCEACQKEHAIQEKTITRSEGQIVDLEAGDAGLLGLKRSFDDILEKAGPNFSESTLSSPPVHDAHAPSPTVDQDGNFEALLSIGGMTCASCTSSITHGLLEQPYVDSVNVTLITNSATVVFNGKANIERLVEAVEDLGFECTVENCNAVDRMSIESREERERAIMLKLDGMFCGNCPTRIVEAIGLQFSDAVEISKMPSLNDPIIALKYIPDPPTFTIRSIISTINAANETFKATVYVPPSIEQRSQAMQRQEQRRLLRKLIISFVVAIPTFLIGVVWMSLVPASNSLRKYFDDPVLAGTMKRSDWALLFMATVVYFFAADIFHVRAFKEIRALWRRGSRIPILRRFYRFGSMNLLLSAGTSVAYFSSVAIIGIKATSSPTSSSESSTYFDSVVFLTFFILIGRWLEAFSRAKTGNAVAMLGNLRPDKVILVTLRESSGLSDTEREELGHESTTSIDSKLLEINDVVLIPHGSSPPADGVVTKGTTNFNESSLTGEARAVVKEVGDTVYAGSVNIGDSIHVRVEELNGTSMLDQIVSVVREGQTKRAPVERVVDTITGYFVPIITALAILTFIIWLALGESGALDSRHVNPEQGGWVFWSLEFAIAVFVVACPCGIGLAAPTALFVGSGLAAKHGILVRGGGEAFQEASNIDCVVFDKTGTLTEGGNLEVTDHEMLVEETEAEVVWAITKALEETSSHPLAQALLKLASEQSSSSQITTTSTTEEPGKGLRGTFTTPTATYEAALGSGSFITSLDPPPTMGYFTTSTLTRWKTEAKSVALLALRRLPSEPQQHQEPPPTNPWTLAFIAAISDPIRPSTLPTLSALKARKIPLYMLTGDNPTTASAVAATLSIPQDHVFAGVLPTEKADKIRWLQEHHPTKSASSSSSSSSSPSKAKNNKGKRSTAIVAFVGDGINDAPALTAANVSISLSSATDIAMHSSSFILLSPHEPLASIPTLIDLSRRVFRRVKFNFAWAMVYNLILVPVAAGCFFWVKEGGWRLGPVWGSAAMAGSSLCVVLSSLALRVEGGWWRRRRREGGGEGKGDAGG